MTKTELQLRTEKEMQNPNTNWMYDYTKTNLALSYIMIGVIGQKYGIVAAINAAKQFHPDQPSLMCGHIAALFSSSEALTTLEMYLRNSGTLKITDDFDDKVGHWKRYTEESGSLAISYSLVGKFIAGHPITINEITLLGNVYIEQFCCMSIKALPEIHETLDIELKYKNADEIITALAMLPEGMPKEETEE